MANVFFGNVSADMRLTSDSYGILALIDFNAFIAGFVSVSEEVLYRTDTAASVRQFNADGASVTVTIQGDFPAHTVSYFLLEAMGVEEEVIGSFTLTEDGAIFGLGNEFSARWAHDDSLIVRFADVNVPFDSGQIELPDDPVVLAGSDAIVTGNGQFYLLGYSGNDTLTAGTGNDTLDGGFGVDTMAGGGGEDTYYVDDSGDSINESVYWDGSSFVNAVDRAFATSTYTLGAYVEQLILLGAGALSGTGNALDNEITGNTASNLLYGLAGADVFMAGGGNDTIDGGEGDDTARLIGATADYLFTTDSALQRVFVTGSGAGVADGIDALTSVEHLSFADRVLGFAFRDEFNANATATGWQQAPAVVGLADGGFLAAWSDDGPYAIEARRFSAGGTPQSSDQAVSLYSGFASMQSDATLSRLSDGTIVATWTSNLQDGSLTGVYGRRLDGNGAPLGAEFIVNGTTEGYQQSGATSALAGGGFVAVWSSSQVDVYDVFARRFNAEGLPIGAEFQVNTFTPWYQDKPVVAGTSDGGFVAAWASTVDQGVHSGIYARRFDASGIPLGDEFSVHTYFDPLSPFKANPAIAVLAGGGLVVAWDSPSQDGGGKGVYAQRFDADGNRVGGELRLNTTTAGDQFEASLAALPDGGFFAAWTSLPGGNEAIVASQRFDAQGNKVGDETLILTPLAGDRAEPAVSALVDGRIVALWRTTDADVWGVAGREFDPSGQLATEGVIAGGSAGDIVRADAGNQFIEGFDGEDRLDAGGGDDTLVGGGGADTLLGGANEDRLFGNAGNDSLDGGAGTDTVDYATAASGVVVELWKGTAASDGQGGADVLLGIENAVGGTFNDLVVGNESANRLEAANGNDSLLGGGGSDTLLGGGNDDRLWGNAGSDLLDGGAGTDTVDYATAASGVTVELWKGTAGNDGQGGADTLIGIEHAAGGGFNDLLVGNESANRLEGANGNDSLLGGGGNDTLLGGANDDRLWGNAGNDTLDGGTGNDTVDYATAASGVTVEIWKGTATNDGQGGADTLISIEHAAGGAFNDLLVGTEGSNRVEGVNGNDSLLGGGGNDTLMGGANDDRLWGNAGNDTLDGGTGNDTADYATAASGVTVEIWKGTAGNDGQGGADTLITIEHAAGGGFNDLLVGNESANRLEGANGNDSLLGGGGNDTLLGGASDDRLWGNAGNDTLDGGTGNDTADYAAAASGVTVEIWKGTATNDGQGGADTLISIEHAAGGGFNDLLVGNEAANRVEGANGNDSLLGGGGNDTLLGGASDDRLWGNAGNDTLDGGTGNDTADYAAAASGVTVEIWKGTATNDGQGGADVLVAIEHAVGGSFNDFLVGNEGANSLNGGNGNDTLLGGGGADTLIGGAGNDVLASGNGNDVLSGGSDADRFVFDTALGASNIDQITDFTVVDDTIDLENAIFASLGLGALASGSFLAQASAADPDDFILYDPATGVLAYDADGSGSSSSAQQFASVALALAITATDFSIV